jgi:RNA polymerase sigma-70 factor, ECF subfamily
VLGSAAKTMSEPRETVTRLLVRLRGADDATRSAALQEILERLYPELRRLAGRLMRRERPGHTLQPTALVHEAFLQLVDETAIDWQCRAHFMGVAARVMRRVLVDHARRRGASKRGGGLAHVTLDEALAAGGERSLDVLHLDEALERFAALDARGARVVEMRVFGGLTSDEAATVLGVSKRTVDSDWAMARLWLARELRAPVDAG